MNSQISITSRAVPAPQAPVRMGGMVLFLLVTLAYLLMESVYNAGVVRMLSSPGVSKETVEGMEVIGKAMASIGITLFLSRVISMPVKWLFAPLAALIYVGLGMAVNSFIDQIPATAKVGGHWLGMYRVAVLEGRVEDRELFHPGMDPKPAQRVALANIALISKADNADIRKAGVAYIRGMVSEKVGNKDIGPEFERFWKVYSFASEKLRPVWNWYRQQVYQQEHRQPSMAEFMSAVADSNRYGPLFRRYKAKVLYEGKAEYGIARITAGDVPLFESKAALRARFNRFIADGKTTVVSHYIPKEWNANAGLTRDLASSVFIPPISMTLSLFSVFLNVASVAGLLAAIGVAICKPVSTKAANHIQRAVTLSAFAAILALTGVSPFPDGTRFAEAQMRAASDNLAGKVWSMGLDRELQVLGFVESSETLTAWADRLPSLGNRMAN